MSEIWAVLEHREGTFHENTGELLAELADIAQRQQDQATLCTVVLTSPDTTPLDTTLLTAFGMQRLYLMEHPQLAHYTTEGYVSALAWLVQQHTPRLVVGSATANGRDWTPRLAARLHLPFVANCLGLDLHDDALFALRAIYEGRAYIQTRTALHGRTALATLLAGVRGTPAQTRDIASPLPPLAIAHLTPEIGESSERQRLQRLAIQAPSAEEIELEAAEKIVAGGRGVGREGFTHVAAFARLLGAAVGASRVATDQGWIEHARQIGTTGKSVRPKLYIACGISGAAQHTSGVREAQTVVAINPDRSAPILALADLGLLGDANQVLPLAAEMIEHRDSNT
ncbi:MAG TPA: electron transfer flavoprotein subunit alpha/FixB family protein [Ktedonobacteraceae bacterium]|nr:electron transfer flavoprotein subunit alpha/FixB family protein [Ktedonobacteraceae bacterium]